MSQTQFLLTYSPVS